jgi:hypothetical protein
MAMAPKSKKEVDEDGLECGTHRLQILDNRGGPSFYNGIDLMCRRSTISVNEANVQSTDSKMEQGQIDKEKI